MRRGGQDGFTLVEMLVSLALLGVTATLLLAAISTGRGTQRRAEDAALAAESVAAAQGVLRDRLQAMVADTLYGGPGARVDVRGDGSVLSWTAPPAAAFQPSPPQRFRLLLTQAGELSLFSLDPLSTRANPDAPQLSGWRRVPLLGNAATLSISYFGPVAPGRARAWTGFWQERATLPDLVRVRVGFARGDRRTWPDLIVRPAANVNSACRIDTATGTCRTGAP